MIYFTSSRLLVCCAAVLMLPGCMALEPGYDFEEPRPEVVDADVALGNIGPVTVRVTVTQDEAQPSKFSLAARLDHTVTQPRKDGAICPRFPGLGATLDGAALALGSLGGWTPDNYPVCRMPGLFVAIAPSALSASVLTIGDSSKTVSIELGDRLQLRTALLVAPPAGGYRSGDTMSIRWSHAGDLATALPSLVVQRQPQPIAIPPGSITRAGDTLTFALPQELPLGPSTLRIHQTSDVTACSGLCSIVENRVVELLFDVRAP